MCMGVYRTCMIYKRNPGDSLACVYSCIYMCIPTLNNYIPMFA